MKRLILFLLLFFLAPITAYPHSGRTNSDGCHTNKNTGDYHCHSKKKKSSPSKTKSSKPTQSKEQHILGRWCDVMVPTGNMNRVITIILSKKGIPEAKVKYFDGSAGNYQLTDLGNGMFKVNGRDSGDKYRIVPNNGELQLLDNDGFIRTARRLETSSKSGDCLP